MRDCRFAHTSLFIRGGRRFPSRLITLLIYLGALGPEEECGVLCLKKVSCGSFWLPTLPSWVVRGSTLRAICSIWTCLPIGEDLTCSISAYYLFPSQLSRTGRTNKARATLLSPEDQRTFILKQDGSLFCVDSSRVIVMINFKYLRKSA